MRDGGTRPVIVKQQKNVFERVFAVLPGQQSGVEDERGRVFSRQELIDRVWPKDVLVLDRTVDVNITRLRKKIGRFSKCIVTRLGFGYYFEA